MELYTRLLDSLDLTPYVREWINEWSALFNPEEAPVPLFVDQVVANPGLAGAIGLFSREYPGAGGNLIGLACVSIPASFWGRGHGMVLHHWGLYLAPAADDAQKYLMQQLLMAIDNFAQERHAVSIVGYAIRDMPPYLAMRLHRYAETNVTQLVPLPLDFPNVPEMVWKPGGTLRYAVAHQMLRSL